MPVRFRHLLRSVLGAGVLLVASAALAADAPFDRFRALAGEWHGSTADGQPVSVSYEPIAEGTAMLEKLRVGEGAGAHEMATLFHPEGDGVMLTHYCATGNQPRMVATVSGTSFDFELIDVTGLSAPDAGHMRRASFSFPENGELEASWTWHENGGDADTIAFEVSRRSLTTAEDREGLARHLRRTDALLHEAVAGLSPEQLAFREVDDRWSIAEVLEHLAVSEEFIRGAAEAALLTPAATESASLAWRHDELIATVMVDRSRKFQAPEPVVPTSRFEDAAAALAAYESSRSETEALVGEARDLRAYATDHPLVGGPLDAYGWLLFLSSHTERHTLQIVEIKAAAEFPSASAAGAP